MNSPPSAAQARKIIFTHVGTSILLSENLLRNRPPVSNIRYSLGKPGSALKHDDYLEAVQQLLRDHLHRIWKHSDGNHRRRNSPAEIASLALLKPQSGDQVVLLHSATEDGRLCAKALKYVLDPTNTAAISGFPHCSAVVCEVAGLEVSGDGDGVEGELEGNVADLFVRRGLKNYVEWVWEQYDNRQAGDRLIFNITGGYKGMIPIARDLSLLLESHSRRVGKRIESELCYLFQDSNRLVRYGALPIDFDWDFLKEHEELLSVADPKNGGAEEWRFSSLQRQLPFFEKKDDSHLIRSALGEVVLALLTKVA